MSKSSKSNVRKKVTKNIEKQRTIEIMKANINPVTNNPNYSKVNNLTGVDRKTYITKGLLDSDLIYQFLNVKFLLAMFFCKLPFSTIS